MFSKTQRSNCLVATENRMPETLRNTGVIIGNVVRSPSIATQVKVEQCHLSVVGKMVIQTLDVAMDDPPNPRDREQTPAGVP